MRVVALNKFEYANVLRQPGDEFDTTSDKDADILILAQQVKRASEKQVLESRAMKAEDDKASETPHAVNHPKKKYMRRDMRAEK